jgi:hypothetical protein
VEGQDHVVSGESLFDVIGFLIDLDAAIRFGNSTNSGQDHPRHQLGLGRTALLFVQSFPSSGKLSSVSASLYAERLRKDRFRHTADAACIWSYRRIIQEGTFNVARARVGRLHTVSHSWKEEEEAPRERLRG